MFEHIVFLIVPNHIHSAFYMFLWRWKKQKQTQSLLPGSSRGTVEPYISPFVFVTRVKNSHEFVTDFERICHTYRFYI